MTPSPYIDAPTIPAGLTLAEYRRARPRKFHGLRRLWHRKGAPMEPR